jgi:hypothetical protein
VVGAYYGWWGFKSVKQDFHPKVINNTEITFTDHEMALLQKGPKYKLHAKEKDWIQNLAP